MTSMQSAGRSGHVYAAPHPVPQEVPPQPYPAPGMPPMTDPELPPTMDPKPHRVGEPSQEPVNPDKP